MPRFSTKELVQMALFAAILCISAYISIPLPLPGAPHVSMLSFSIILVSLLFPAEQSFLIIFVWMLLGIVGLPVFIAGKSGIGYLLNGYGGYTVSFPIAGIIVPMLKGSRYSRVRYLSAAVVGTVFIDIFGMFWLMASTHIDLAAGILTGFVPFIPLDMLKAVVASQLAPVFLVALDRGPGKRVDGGHGHYDG